MNRANQNRLNSPIITRVIELNKYLLRISDKAFKLIKRNYLDAILKQGATLFNYAMRQLKGLDYKKRACDLVYEIQSNIYFISALGGCDARLFVNKYNGKNRYIRKTKNRRKKRNING